MSAKNAPLPSLQPNVIGLSGNGPRFFSLALCSLALCSLVLSCIVLYCLGLDFLVLAWLLLSWLGLACLRLVFSCLDVSCLVVSPLHSLLLCGILFSAHISSHKDRPIPDAQSRSPLPHD
jgi:hypothetical protein